jgi:hypothetical protein
MLLAKCGVRVVALLTKGNHPWLHPHPRSLSYKEREGICTLLPLAGEGMGMRESRLAAIRMWPQPEPVSFC